jgi:hypothetical protein
MADDARESNDESDVLVGGTITFTLDLAVSALGAESLVVFNACFANPI